jgi:KDO2-lipid IV(A) lauroyltransferase
LLPDQVPPNQQGIWAPFFGKAAYTMTLSARLALQTNATVLLAWGERLRWGRGYRIHVQTLPQALSTDLSQAVAQINHAMETLIQTQPSQYLWGYARYKAPRDAAQPNPT